MLYLPPVASVVLVSVENISADNPEMFHEIPIKSVVFQTMSLPSIQKCYTFLPLSLEYFRIQLQQIVFQTSAFLIS